MNYACNSCGARYAIPDSRVSAAGEQGLRVRCSRCRAIMAVCQGDEHAVSSLISALGDDESRDWGEDVTQPLGKRRRRSAPSDEAMAALSSSDGPAPAALSSSGVYRPLPGVERDVTGLHMPAVSPASPGREWYAAFGGRARGPYSKTELELLAEQGRVRSSTLVWRPGFSSWVRVRADDEDGGDVAWLRAVVEERKRKERRASERAAREHGIHRLHLDDFSAPPKTPPPLPVHEVRQLFVGKKLPSKGALAADRVFGPPHLGEARLGTAALLERRRRHHVLSFTAGALWAALALALATYTLPALGVTLDDVLALVRAVVR